MHNNDQRALKAAPPARIPAAQPGVLTTDGAACVAGVDVGGTNLRLALADSAGNVLARWSSSTVGVRGPEAVIGLIGAGVRDTLRQTGAPPDSLRAIAAGVPGVTDVENGVVIATSYLMEWRDVALRSMLEEELGVPAVVDNDVNLAAIGESWAGAAKGASDFVFLAIGTGIGAGIVLDGRLYRGSGWGAGEIGYMLLPGTADGPGQDHEPGALEKMIGGEGIKAQWQRLWSAAGTPLPRDLTATAIFDCALDGDALAQTILRQSATMLAQAVYNVSSLLDCPLFVLGGGVGTHPALQASAQGILQGWNARPRLVPSALGSDAQLQGAIRVALDTAGVQAG
jgi:glucokinase